MVSRQTTREKKRPAKAGLFCYKLENFTVKETVQKIVDFCAGKRVAFREPPFEDEHKGVAVMLGKQGLGDGKGNALFRCLAHFKDAALNIIEETGLHVAVFLVVDHDAADVFAFYS